MTGEHLHIFVRSHAIVANKLSTLATESFGLRSRTHFANGFHFSMCFYHFRTQLLHSVDEKCSGQLIGVVLRQNRSSSAFWADKGTIGPCLYGQLSDALLAIVVEAREEFGVAEVFVTNRAGDLLL